MNDQDPDPAAPGESAGGRNEWDFEAPDPMLSFHGDIPTGPDALQDRPTGAPAPPPATGAAVPVGAAAAAAAPPETVSGGVDPGATRVVPAAAPLTTGTPAGDPPAKRVGTRTAAILVGVAALVGLLIVAGLALTGGEDSDVVATDTTPRPEATAEPTAEPTTEPTPDATPTPGPTATPEPPPSAANDLQATTAAFGGEVSERWDLTDGRLTSTIEITNDTDAAIEGLYLVIVPPSVTDDLADVTFAPEAAEVVEADDPAAAFAVALEPGDPPLTITWSAQVVSEADETPEAALERLLGDRAAAEFRFAADGPDLTVNAPDDGSTTIGSSVTLRGQTDPDATLTVAGDRVQVSADNGRFRTEIERTSDRREITIVATDPYGRATELTWTVRFADPAPTPTPRPVVVPTTPPVVAPTPVPPRPTSPPRPTTCPPTRPSC